MPPDTGISSLSTPYEVNMWVKNNIDKKTLKKWDAAVSDDVILTQVLESKRK